MRTLSEKANTTAYAVFSGTVLLFTAPTRAEAAERIPTWCKGWVQIPLLTKVRYAPDGRITTTPPAPAGTWAGTCGATLWVADPEFRMVPPPHRYERDHAAPRAWHRHWVLDDSPYFPREKRAERALGGFRIECEQPRRHEGPCQQGPHVWTWEHAADARENIARRSGVQVLPLAEVGP